MDFKKVIEKRKSIREFKDKSVGINTLKGIVQDGILSPSAGNRQPWEFVVVTKKSVIHALALAAHNQTCVSGAPAIIVVIAHPEASAARYGERGSNLYSIQDTAAAVQTMLLSITNRKLGAVWVGAFEEELVSEAIQLPAGYRAVAMIPLGFPAVTPARTSRRSLDEVIHFDQW
jgi:nitroreductase